MSTPAQAREAGQQLSLLGLTEEAFTTFLRIVRDAPTARPFTIDDLAEQLDAAQIKASARGALMNRAIGRGLIEPATVHIDGTRYDLTRTTRGPNARGRLVRSYRRTGKDAA